MSIEVEKIEGKEDRVRRQFAAAPAERLLQSTKVGPSLFVEDHGFAVEDGCCDIEFSRGSNDCGKAMGPVVPAARQDTHAAVVDMDRQSIAVKFDLVEPSGAGGRLLLQKRQAGLDPLGHPIEG